MKNIILTSTLTALALMGTACAHTQTEQALDQKLQNQPSHGGLKELGEEAEQVFKTAPNLTDAQKNKLLGLHQKTHDELVRLQNESFRLRDVLIQDLAATNYDRYEVDLIKVHLRNVEGNRVNVVLDAIDEANTILGRSFPEGYGVLSTFDEPRVSLPPR